LKASIIFLKFKEQLYESSSQISKKIQKKDIEGAAEIAQKNNYSKGFI
jgi:hypothetical protein